MLHLHLVGLSRAVVASLALSTLANATPLAAQQSRDRNVVYDTLLMNGLEYRMVGP